MFKMIKEFFFGKSPQDELEEKYKSYLDDFKKERRLLEEVVAEHKFLLTKPTITEYPLTLVTPLVEGKTKANVKKVTAVPKRPKAPPSPPVRKLGSGSRSSDMPSSSSYQHDNTAANLLLVSVIASDSHSSHAASCDAGSSHSNYDSGSSSYDSGSSGGSCDSGSM